MSKKRTTASDIRAAMAKSWAAPEWAIMWEVGEGTGARSGRFADAVMMSLWPSRGLELHGVEIKVSRSDWKREAADPSKAEAVAKYCDRWWIHTPPGVVSDLSELPPMWGLREFDGAKWKTIREAEKTEAVQISRHFLAAMLRRADGVMKSLMDEAMREAREAQFAEIEEQRKRFRSEVDRAVERQTEKLRRASENVAAFEAAFGASATAWGLKHARLGAAARALVDCGDHGFGDMAKRLRKAADEIEAIAAMSVPDEAVQDALRSTS